MHLNLTRVLYEDEKTLFPLKREKCSEVSHSYRVLGWCAMILIVIDIVKIYQGQTVVMERELKVIV